MLSGKPADSSEIVPVNKPPPPYQNQYTHNAVYDQYESYVPAISRHSGLDKRRPRRAPEKEQVLRNSSRVTLFPNGCVAAGGYHTAVIDEEGCLYTWGCGTHGQLGLGFPEVKAVGMKKEFDAVEPRHVKMFSAHYRAVQVSAGVQHTMVVAEDGRLWSCGATDAFLGHGLPVKPGALVFTPKPVATNFDTRVAYVSAGWCHTAFLTDLGQLFSFGAGADGRLGHGTTDDVAIPACVESCQDVTFRHVACGGAHSVAVSAEGEVYTWGKGISVGHGDGEDCLLPQKVDALGPLMVDVCAAGGGHCAVVTDEGDVYMWGTGAQGQLGNGTRKDELLPVGLELYGVAICRVALGAFHSLLAAKTGDLITFGAGGPTPQGLDAESDVDAQDAIGVAGGERGRLCQGYKDAADVDSSDDEDEIPEPEGKISGLDKSQDDDDDEDSPRALDEITEEMRVKAEERRQKFEQIQQQKLIATGEDSGDRVYPKIVNGPWRLRQGSKTAHVAAGGYHTTLVTESGDVFSAGVGRNGRLGLGNLLPAITPQHVRALDHVRIPAYILSENVRNFGQDRLTPDQKSGLSSVQD